MIDFWFSVGSTYTYLSVMRLTDVERKTGLPFRWRPFSVRHIMIEQNNIPFRNKPAKMGYMWRDIERRAVMYGLSTQMPVPYPLSQWDLANRVAVLAAEEGWVGDYARATFRRWFQQSLEPGSEPNLSESLKECGQDPRLALVRAESAEIGRTYEAATQEARALGIFGSPTFAVGRELFWGDDRLEDAIAWHSHGTLARQSPS